MGCPPEAFAKASCAMRGKMHRCRSLNWICDEVLRQCCVSDLHESSIHIRDVQIMKTDQE